MRRVAACQPIVRIRTVSSGHNDKSAVRATIREPMPLRFADHDPFMPARAAGPAAGRRA